MGQTTPPSLGYKSRRAGLLYFYCKEARYVPAGTSVVSIPATGIVVFLQGMRTTPSTGLMAVCFHPGERDCCISTADPDLLHGDALTIVSIPASGIVVFLPPTPTCSTATR